MNTMTRKQKKTDLETLRQQEMALRAWFEQEKLNPDSIYEPPQEPERRVAVLLDLASWVTTWHKLRNRRHMEAKGFLYPPVEPDYDPDSDWLLFESWVQGKPLQWSLADAVKNFEEPGQLDAERTEERAEAIASLLEDRGVQADLRPEIPAKIRYAYLLKVAREEKFPLMAEGTFMVLGCSGFCPGCIQRLWCENGRETGWLEDEEAGGLALTPEIKEFL